MGSAMFFCKNWVSVFAKAEAAMMGTLGGGGGEDGGLSGLQETIPGIPGEDYPIYADVPESEFSCDERVKYCRINANNI